MTANVASKYFTMAEMRCRDGTPYPAIWSDRLVTLFSQLDVIRERHGGALVVVSGYRTPSHNDAVGGAEKSQHPEGRAVDIRPWYRNRVITGSDVQDLHSEINELVAEGKLPLVGGIGFYRFVRDKTTHLLMPGWVHLDTRPKPASGHIARWEGERFGDEMTA